MEERNLRQKQNCYSSRGEKQFMQHDRICVLTSPSKSDTWDWDAGVIAEVCSTKRYSAEIGNIDRSVHIHHFIQASHVQGDVKELCDYECIPVVDRVETFGR